MKLYTPKTLLLAYLYLQIALLICDASNLSRIAPLKAGSQIQFHANNDDDGDGDDTTNPPVVTNLPPSNVSFQSAALNGDLLSTDGEPPEVTFYYGTTDGGTNPAAWDANVPLGNQSDFFATTVSNLAEGTIYYYTAFASNSKGVAWGSPSQSFQTLSPTPAVIANTAATGVQANSAILNGQILSIGSQLPSVILYYGPADGGTNAGAWANGVSLGQQDGSYSYTISGLTSNSV